METKNLSISEYMEKLSAGSSTPGGGSASAVTGSIAAALVAMIARLTMAKKEGGYEAVAAQMEEVAAHADDLRDHLLLLADEDSAAFEKVLEAYRLPKESDAERETRDVEIQKAMRHAIEVPFHIAERCNTVLHLSEVVANKGVRTAVSDAGTAAGLAEAALHSALLNVDINLKSVKDQKYIHLYHLKKEDLAKNAKMHKRATLAIVEDWVNPEHP